MSKSFLVFVLAILACRPALSADQSASVEHSVSAGHNRRIVLPPERHVIELVRPPYSGAFIINNAHFTAKSPACLGWVANERVTLLAGDWHGRCLDALFYNVSRRQTCEMWCGPIW
jgi:hypothetical protein